MAGSTIVLLLLCSLAMISVMSGNRSKPVCLPSKCENFTPQQIIVNLWGLPKKPFSPLVESLKCNIFKLAKESKGRQLALLFGLSLWSVDLYTGMKPKAHPTCFYGSIVNQTLAVDSGNIESEKVIKSIKDYGELCAYAIDFTIYVGLTAAGCPAKYPGKQSTEILKPCPITKEMTAFLNSKTNELPASLKLIVAKLLKSSCIQEQSLASAALASSTKSSVDLFENLLSREELVKTARLKACNYRIPRCCCAERELALRANCQQLTNTTSEAINTLAKQYEEVPCKSSSSSSASSSSSGSSSSSSASSSSPGSSSSSSSSSSSPGSSSSSSSSH